MTTDYYDIDDILAENERITCKFNIEVKGLGYLEESGSEDIYENSKLELPLWLAGILSGIPITTEDGEEIRLLDLIRPEAFNKKILNSIKSNSVNVSLRLILNHYYRLSEKWGFWFQDTEFIEAIQQMLKDRSVVINDYSFNISLNNNTKEEVGKFISGLDETEKQLFEVCGNSHVDVKVWMAE